jgi:hypothetical protein
LRPSAGATWTSPVGAPRVGRGRTKGRSSGRRFVPSSPSSSRPSVTCACARTGNARPRSPRLLRPRLAPRDGAGLPRSGDPPLSRARPPATGTSACLSPRASQSRSCSGWLHTHGRPRPWTPTPMCASTNRPSAWPSSVAVSSGVPQGLRSSSGRRGSSLRPLPHSAWRGPLYLSG